MYTLRDAMKEKQLVNMEFDARLDARDAESKRIAGILEAHPEIGVLNGGKYYSFKSGKYKEATDPAELA
jgi:hypothetical protein